MTAANVGCKTCRLEARVLNLLVITSLRRWDPLCKMREDVTQTHGLQVNETTCTFGVEQAQSFVIPAELWLIENRTESPPKMIPNLCSVMAESAATAQLMPLAVLAGNSVPTIR